MNFFSVALNSLGFTSTPKAKADASPSAGTGWGGWPRFFDAADPSNLNSNFGNNTPRDFQDDARKWDYDLIVSASRRLYANSGISRIIDDKALYSVGRAWRPRFMGKNIAWGQKATDWLEQSYYPICDVRGRNYDFQTNLHLDSVNVDVSGDFGKLLTESESGFPQTQRIPSHRINSGEYPDGEAMKDGPYQGLVIRQGVVYNRVGRPVAYGITTDEGWELISARDLIHVFDPQWYDQGRGLPALTPVLEDMKSLKRTQGFEQMAMEILSNIGLVEENPEGMADVTDPRNRLLSGATPGNAATTTAPVMTQTLLGGLIRFFKSNSGSKLSTLQHGRPGPNWESFWDRIIKGAVMATSWSYEVAWKLNTLGGAALCAAFNKCNRACQDRQDVLRPGAKQEVQYAIAKAIKIGALDESDEWYLWEFTMPGEMTADIGREQAQDRADYLAKITSLHDILTPQGKTVDDHLRQLATEELRRIEIGKEMGVSPIILGQQPKNETTTVSEKV